MIYTFGKDFLQPLLLKVSETFLFRQSKKAYGIRWSVSVIFALLEKRRPNRHLMVRNINICSYVLQCKFSLQNSRLKYWLCFRLFCGENKNNLRLQFRSSFKEAYEDKLRENVFTFFSCGNWVRNGLKIFSSGLKI